MASHENREPLVWAACVLGLAALFVLIGLMTSARAAELHERSVPLTQPVASAEPDPLPPPLDPQPEVSVSHVAFSISGELDSAEVAALLARLGGADPTLSGLAKADPTLDELAVQRAIRDVPGAERHAVMGVIIRGGQSAGIGVERTTTDPLTGVVTGRHQVNVVATVTVLEDERLALTASLQNERDTSALAVISRQAGIDLGRTGQAEGALVLAPGEPAVIRLPGPELQVVFLKVRAMGPPRVETQPPADPSTGSEDPG